MSKLRSEISVDAVLSDVSLMGAQVEPFFYDDHEAYEWPEDTPHAFEVHFTVALPTRDGCDVDYAMWHCPLPPLTTEVSDPEAVDEARELATQRADVSALLNEHGEHIESELRRYLGV